MKQIKDLLPPEELLCQLAEEASELAQAALKLRRCLDGTNPTPRSEAECRANLNEEVADVLLCINQMGDLIDIGTVLNIELQKSARWLSRLEGRTDG